MKECTHPIMPQKEELAYPIAEDQGLPQVRLVSVGAVYWFPQYDVTDPVARLLTDGYVDFVRVD